MTQVLIRGWIGFVPTIPVYGAPIRSVFDGLVQVRQALDCVLDDH
jgi:hypothetical protein